MYSMVLMAALSTGGDVPAWGRHGCHGGWGGCYGCWGGCYGCYGCWGGYGGWGTGYGYAYAAPIYAAPAIMTASATRIAAPMMAALPPDAARIVVDLPADARLFVDGQPTKSTASRRVLQSPGLEPGSRYSYLLRAELQRDGKKYQQTKKVAVRAGQETTASFSEPGILQTAQAGR